jgi:4-diphosphocytidyl-2-C-methyl-D-erythritol kinase
MSATKAYAKINLALVVGPLRPDGKHEVVTVLERIALHDDVALEPAAETTVDGFPEDTLVRAALETLARAARVDHGWVVRLEKRIPVAAGLGGGSSDAAAALALANATLEAPLPDAELHSLASELGSDVPFFLRPGAQLATGDGTALVPLALPTDYAVLLVVPHEVAKESTASVYAAFDRRDGARGFAERAARVHDVVHSISDARDLAALPPNDLAASPLADELLVLGAFRADVSGAGPTVYGLFREREDAMRAEEAVRTRGRTIVTEPA